MHTEKELQAAVEKLRLIYMEIDNDTIGNAGMEELLCDLKVPNEAQHKICDIVRGLVSTSIENLCYDLLHNSGITYAKENAWIRVDSGELPPVDGDHNVSIRIEIWVSGKDKPYIGRYWFSTDMWNTESMGFLHPGTATHWRIIIEPKD